MTPHTCEHAVLVALSRFPMTSAELAQETGYSKRSVQAALRSLRGEKVYIVTHRHSDGRKAMPVPVYKLGKRKDAKAPRTSNAARIARSRARRRRNTSAPFSLGDVWQNVAAA